MANQYRLMRERHQERMNAFPIAFAFDNDQFTEAMRKLDLNPTDTDKVYSIGGGGIIRKSDDKAFGDMLKDFENEANEAIDADTTGDGFIFDMFTYELANHEYSYTGDVEPALNVIGLTLEEVESDEKLARSFKKAKSFIRSREDW